MLHIDGNRIASRSISIISSTATYPGPRMRPLLPLSLSVLGRRRLRVLWPKVPVVEVVGQSDAEVVEDVRVGRQDAGKIAEVGNVVLLRPIVRGHLIAEEEHERSLAPQAAMPSFEIETCFRIDFTYRMS